jgi:hypothetical protein
MKQNRPPTIAVKDTVRKILMLAVMGATIRGAIIQMPMGVVPTAVEAEMVTEITKTPLFDGM